MLSSGPNLLYCLIGSSDPFDGLVIEGPLLLFLTGLCGLTAEDDAAGLEDAVDCGLVPVVEEEEVAGVEGTDDEDGGGADDADDVDGADVTEGCEVCVAMEQDNVTGSAAPTGQVMSVWVETVCADRAAEAYDLPTVGVDCDCFRSCCASANETFFSNLRRVMSLCRFHSGQSLENAG